MANLSDAHGKITLLAKNEKCIQYLIQFLKNAEQFDYSTEMVITNDSPKLKLFRNENWYYLSFYFNGVGRWAYDNNVKNMMEDISYFIEQYEIIQMKNIIKKLESSEWLVEFDFVDKEGVDVFYSEKISISHDENKPINEIKFDIYDFTSIKLTIENLIEYKYADNITDAIYELMFQEEEIDDYEANELISVIQESEDYLINRFGSVEDALKTEKGLYERFTKALTIIEGE